MKQHDYNLRVMSVSSFVTASMIILLSSFSFTQTAYAQNQIQFGASNNSSAATTNPNTRPPRRTGRDDNRGGGIDALGLAIGIGRTLKDISDREKSRPPKRETKTKRKPRPKSQRKTTKKTKPRRNQTRSGTQRAQPNIPTFRNNEILIIFTANTDNAVISAVANDYGLRRLDDEVINLLDLRLVKFSRPRSFSAEQALQLANDPRVERVQPNYIYSLSQSKKGKRPAIKHYALEKLDVEKAHQLSRGKDIRIAVIDSQINKNHPSLKGAVMENYDAIGAKTKYRDSHGTQVASIIAARNTKKMVGVAPQAHILAIRAFAKTSRRGPQLAETFHIVRGIDWSIKNKAQILNLSFAGPRDKLMQDALQKASDLGIIMVAAAGNRGPKSPPVFPAAYKPVIAVTATDPKDKIYKNANRGDYITIAAPGVRVLTASGKKGYGLKSGTSMATAYVTGVLALILQITPELDSETAISLLELTSLDLGEKGHDKNYGYGLINSYRMLADDPENLTYQSAQK